MKSFFTMGFCLSIGLSVVTGCGGGGAVPGSIEPLSHPHLNRLPPTGQQIYVVNLAPKRGKYDSVTVYPVSASGNATPSATISGKHTGLDGPYGVAVDAAGKIYVANVNNNTVTVYAPGANGDVSSAATISGASTGLNHPFGVAVDAAGKIYVANFYTGGPSNATGSISVYASGANGNATPIATITGSNTGLAGPTDVTLDAAGNVYVADLNTDMAGGVTVYAAGASGNVAPIATISGSNTLFNGPSGIGIDAAGNIYVSNNNAPLPTTAVTIFATGSNGNVAPTATISGANTGIKYPNGVALDANGNIYTVGGQATGGPSINIFAAGANGNVAPIATITGTNTGLSGPHAIAVH